MKRYHQEKSVMRRNIKLAKIFNCPLKPYGCFRKKDSMDCGKSQCGCCSSHKFPKRELTQKEILANFNFKEQTRFDFQ